MAKKIVKKKKIKFLNLFIILLVMAILAFFCYLLLSLPIRNIIVSGNNYVLDDDILKLANIYDYPSFLTTTDQGIKKRLKKIPYIKDVKVYRSFYNVVTIKVKENIPLFINNTNQTVVFSDKSEVKIDECIYNFRIPRLINYVPDEKYSSFIKHLSKIDSTILGRISDIEYQPNDFDKDRFLLYMDDDNMVYLTLSKFKAINLYDDVIPQLDNKKGILYLDSGNHFQIKQ